MALDKKIFMFNVILVLGILLNSIYFDDIGGGGLGDGGGIDEPIPGPDDDIYDPTPDPDPACIPGTISDCYTGIPGICSRGERLCKEDSTWDDCQQIIFPETEICDDGLDNDCDGKTDRDDEDCQCVNGTTQPCSTNYSGICSTGEQFCAGGIWQKCISPLPGDFSELCYDGLDNDCDTLTDQEDLDCVELCINRLDDDFDNLIDMEDADECPRTCTSVYEKKDTLIDKCCADWGLDGITDQYECLTIINPFGDDPQLILPPEYFKGGKVIPVADMCMEDCFNDIDDDCDGLDDYSDPDCVEILRDVCNNQRDDDNDGIIDDCYCGEYYESQIPLGYAECIASRGIPVKIPGDLGEDGCWSAGEWYCDCPEDTYNYQNICIACADFEICNDGLDNDCDGFTDCEDTECFVKNYCECRSGTSRECGPDTGACTKGNQKCISSHWQECKNAVLPVKEICDDLIDNDCDGKVDEGCTDEICNGIDDNLDGAVDEGCPCVYGATINCGIDEGLCQFGYQVCVGEEWSQCNDAVWPKNERCDDNLDNDCDGYVDEDCFTTASNPDALNIEVFMASKIEVKSIQEITVLNKKTKEPIEGAYIFIISPLGLIETFTTGANGKVFFRADEVGVYNVEVNYRKVKLKYIFLSQNLFSMISDSFGSVGFFFFGNYCAENSLVCLFMIILAFAASLLSYYVAGNYFSDTKKNLPKRLTAILTRLVIGVIFFFTPLFVIKVAGIIPGYLFSVIEIGLLLGLEYYKNGWTRIKNLKTLIFPKKP